MKSPNCPTKACTGEIDIGDWIDNDYCSFAEGDCPQCVQKFWIVVRDGRMTLRIREEDEGEESFDQRDADRKTNLEVNDV